MVQLSELVGYADQLMAVNLSDYCPNGLQVEGRPEIRKIVSGVTACQSLLDKAVELGADLILVHHGYFWKGENPCVAGIKRQRLKTLLSHDISLVAYHLPLDVHETLGNNVQLAQRLGLHITGKLDPESRHSIGLVGELSPPLALDDFAALINAQMQRAPMHIAGHASRIKRVAWCTGAAQGYIEKAIAQGVDAYISGEISEPTVHVARESGIHYFAAGHHATERYGVQALGEHLAERFGIQHQFVDIDNPV